MSVALRASDVRGGYGETEIVRGVSFAVEPGEAFALVGKNGAGKTTLVKLLLRLLPSRGGTVELLGDDVSRAQAYKVAGGPVGYAPQEGALFPDLTVNENLRLGAMRLRGRDFEARRERMVELFPVLGKRLTQLAGTLSGGEQKMLIVARALLRGPRIAFLDEVSEGLQPSVTERIQEALTTERRDSGMTVVLIEQNIDFVLGSSDRYALVERGELVGSGRVDEPETAERIEEHLAI